MAQALDIGRAFRALIVSYLSLRGTPARRGDIKEGVTQLLLSLPEQKAVEGPASGLFDFMAALQAAGPKAAGALQPAEIVAGAPAATAHPLPEDVERLQPATPGDVSEVRDMVSALQDAVQACGRAGSPTPAMPGAIEHVAAVWPEEEGMAGELSGIYASIAGLRAAMDYLRVNVPTLADFVALQRAIVSMPGGAAVSDAAAPVAVTIEGVQPKAAAPVSLPDMGGSDDSAGFDLGSKFNDSMKKIVDNYLGTVGLGVDTLKNFNKSAGSG